MVVVCVVNGGGVLWMVGMCVMNGWGVCGE